MNRKTKKMLKIYYEAPKPERKRAFLAKWNRRKIRIWKKLFLQLRYLSKWHLVCSALLFGIMVNAGRYAGQHVLGMLYALVPFLVMLSVTESMRSVRFGMAELEGTTLFSLKSVIMMRLLLLGMGNVLCLFILALVRHENVRMEFIHLLVPYFMTAAGSLAIFRKHSGIEGNYMCLALSSGVSVLQFYVFTNYQMLYVNRYNTIWLIICFLLAAALGREVTRTFLAITVQKEDLAWD